MIRVCRNWKGVDMKPFCYDLANRNSSPVFDADNVAVQSDYFIQNMTDALDIHAPVAHYRIAYSFSTTPEVWRHPPPHPPSALLG